MSPRTLSIGAAQFASEVGDVDANLTIHLDWIARGRQAGLDLLVLPELSLTGHHGPDRLLSAAISGEFRPRVLGASLNDLQIQSSD